MRCSFAMIVAVAFAATACAEPSSDETARDVADVDTASVDALPSGPAPTNEPDDDPAAESGRDAAARIPARFHGEWNADLSACGTGGSETRLRISADRIRFYESVGVVSAVDIESDRVITVSAQYQGEGDTWQDERRLTLAADGRSLTVSGGGDLVRHRCP